MAAGFDDPVERLIGRVDSLVTENTRLMEKAAANWNDLRNEIRAKAGDGIDPSDLIELLDYFVGRCEATRSLLTDRSTFARLRQAS